MVDVGLFILLREDSFFSIFIKVFRDESILSRNGEVSHREVQELSHYCLWIYDHPLDTFPQILQTHHINDLANRIVAHMLLKPKAYLLYQLVLVPTRHPTPSQHQVFLSIIQTNVLPKHFHTPQQPSQILHLHLVTPLTSNRQLRVLKVQHQRFEELQGSFSCIQSQNSIFCLTVYGTVFEVILD